MRPLAPEEEKEIVSLVSLIVVAGLGGIVRWARMNGIKHRTIFGFLTCLGTAAFVGMQAHFIMTWLDVDLSLQFAVSGAVGYGGGVLLDATIPFLVKLLYKKFGIEFKAEDVSFKDKFLESEESESGENKTSNDDDTDFDTTVTPAALTNINTAVKGEFDDDSREQESPRDFGDL